MTIASIISSSREREGPTSSKRSSYELKFKAEVTAYAEQHTKLKPAKDKKVPRSCVKDWTKQEAQLEAQSPLNDKDFDEKLISWIRQQRLKKLRVSRTMARKQALVFSNEAFKARQKEPEEYTGGSDSTLVIILLHFRSQSRLPHTAVMLTAWSDGFKCRPYLSSATTAQLRRP
ncbi:hypothetical protein OESDEN_08793 [Oesophagostomum dentatum]|uniref:Brinker DNA-binding domain-containing protein n=1 Tax=Oesophagostomum dentatum TaxID=61180 RepID=A0A0B1T6B3_OESDE|nr:hypothetical protein OESDEN_08793 [Oesophagostomum dentatum]